MSVASRLMKAFAGFEKAHGRYEVKSKNTKGKAEGRAVTIKSAVTEQIWEEHLSGTGAGLGIIPLREDDTCLWGAIDVDIIGIDLPKLEQEVRAKGFPLIVCRSKSGGAHLYVFLKHPIAADLLTEKLSAWSAALGYGGCEIFPKQIHRVDSSDMGNWINLPYFKAEATTRYAIKDGKAVSVEDFANLVEHFSVSGDEIAAISTEKYVEWILEWFLGAPPCLKALAALGGFPDGTRNNGMVNIIVYLKKRYPDGWQGMVHKYNERMCTPNLSYQEIEVLIKSMGKKDYEYKCKEAPIRQYCNRAECLKQEFGIGGVGTGERSIHISNVTKIKGDPVIWYVGIETERLKLTTDHLMSQSLFFKEVIEKLNFFPVKMPDARWAKMINEKIALADIIEVPEDATMSGQFEMLLHQFLINQNRAKTMVEITRNVVFLDPETNMYVFKSQSLINYLKNQGFAYKKPGEIWNYLRELGGEAEQKWIEGHNVRTWKIKSSIVQLGNEQKTPNFGEEL